MAVSMTNRTMPFVLGALFIIPVAGTLYRLAEIILEGHWSFRFNPEFVDRLPLFIHGVTMLMFLVLGAMQFLPPIRQKGPRLHRVLGRLAGAGAVLGGLSGVWMTLAHSEISTPLLFTGRLIFGTAMAAFAIFAIRDAMHRNFVSHRNWIIRSYAIAFNAASMPLLYMPIIMIIGQPVPIIDDALQVAGWIINLVVAERIFINRAVYQGVQA